jgi:hypothetical protein
VDTYPCPACGGVAYDPDGCRSCGRAHDPEAFRLARVREALAGLDDQSRRLADNQADLRAQRADLEAERLALTNALSHRITAERTGSGGPARSGPPHAAGPTYGGPSVAAPPRPRPTSTATLTATLTAELPPEEPVGAETSPRSAQNAMLTLGGVLLAIAAVVFAGLFYSTTQSGGRAFILAVATTLALGVPVLLARKRLVATAETIAGFGMLVVLLDGYVAYSADLAGVAAVSGYLYAAILFALVAGVAVAYRLATHLRAPQFAGLLAVQPLLPLLALHLSLGRDGFAVVLALVAAQNLGAVAVFSRDAITIAGRTWRPPRRDAPRSSAWPRLLREFAWVLFGVSLAGSVALAVVGLVRADTVTAAVRSSLALLLAAAVGAVGGHLSRHPVLRQIGAGGATLAVIASIGKVVALALPEYTLVLTAAVAATIAVLAGLLPPATRTGAQIGSLVGAGFAALVVIMSAVRTAINTIDAAIDPRPWAADLGAYAERVHTTTWQVPAAALLLAVLTTSAVPPRFRGDAAVLGGLAVVLAAPGAGWVNWWGAPLLAAAGAVAASIAGLFASTGRSAVIRAGTAGGLGAYAVATALARPELTAAVCALLAVVAAATAVSAAAWPDRYGPYADRVGDSAGGAAAFTFPIAVASFVWLLGASSTVLLPITLTAAAAGVLGAALSQAASSTPRTGSAGGALLASAGFLVLTLRIDTGAVVDVALAVVLLLAAAATAASRAFEVAPSGLVEAAAATPRAVDALIGSFVGQARVPEGARRRRSLPKINGVTLGAALAIATMIAGLARLAAAAIPGVGLVTTTLMVLLAAIGVRALPEERRRGPRYGVAVVGGGIGLVTAAVAVTEAVRTVAAAMPWWQSDLASWSDRVTAWAPYGVQVPMSLLLAAGAAWALLPAPVGGDVGFVALSLAGLSAPAAFGLAWWTPMAIAFSLALLAGLGAAMTSRESEDEGLVESPPIGPAAATVVARRRLGLAFVLGLYAVAAGSFTPGTTATVLSGIIGGGVLVTAVAHVRRTTPLIVPGVATASSLVAAPGAAATLAAASGSTRTGVLGSAMAVAAFGVLVLAALRTARVPWLVYPALGVGGSALLVGLAALPDLEQAQVWAAAGALVAVAGAATLRPDRRAATGVIVTTGVPAAVLAAVASAPAWLTALVGPYRTLRQVWQGYAVAPVPEGAGTAMLTLALLACFAGATALTIGGERYLLASILPPVAALTLVAPTALGAPRWTTPWVALLVALATGVGAALSPPTRPSAARLLRGTAGIVCAVTGAAGVAGSLATRTGTLTALVTVLVGAAVAAGLGRDPAVRLVAWVVASGAAFALPVTALAATDRPLRPAAFAVLAVSAVLVALAWLLARTRRRAEAGVVEMCASLGATFALLLTLGSARHAAAVLTIWGILLGGAALRPDRSPDRRVWLVRAALAAEVGATWLLLYAVEVGLAEAYTLPFALVATLAGAHELRHRPELSSWIAYGPALAGGFLPSLALILVGQDIVARWVTLLAAAVVTVIVGSWRRRVAPVVTGAIVAVLVAVVEMIRLLLSGAVAGALLVAVAGIVLIVFGALSEQRLRGALRRMS